MKRSHLIIFLLISLYFSLSWLPFDKFLGGGDVGIPTLYPTRVLNILSNTWWPIQSTGTVNPVGLTAVPLYSFFSTIEQLGVGPSITQKIFFFLIIFISFVSTYILTRYFKISKNYAFLTAIFYNCNLLILSIWHRGIHNSMLFLLFAPLTLALISNGIRRKDYLRIVAITIVSTSMSYVFGSPAFIVSTFLLWGSYLLFLLLVNKNKRFILLFSILLGLVVIISNLWWGIPFFYSGKTALSEFSSLELQNRVSDVVEALRPQNNPVYIFRFLSKFQLFDIKDFGEIYSNRFFEILTWVPTFIVFSTSLIKRVREKKYWIWSFSLLIIVLLLSKGYNPPFGWLTRILFENFTFLAPIRNSYEKLGVILLIPLGLLFSLGINELRKKSVKFLVITICLGIVVWPLWLKSTYSGSASAAVISIPEYYSQADSWISQQNKNYRLLHLPLAPGESIDYDWGYTGIDPSQLFFKGSSISYATGFPMLDLQHKEILRLIHLQDSDNFQKKLSSLNIGVIVFHNEVLWRNRGTEENQRLKKWLDSLNYVKKEKIFGPLEIYKVDENLLPGEIFIANTINFTSDINSDSFKSIWKYKSDKNSIITNQITGLEEYRIYFPVHKIYYWQYPLIQKENALNELPFVRHSLNSKFYPLVVAKDLLSLQINKNDEAACVDMSSKRLVELVKSSSDNYSNYLDQLNKCEFIKYSLPVYQVNDSEKFFLISGKLFRQKTVLEGIDNENAKKALQKLKNFMSVVGVSSVYDPTYSNQSGSIAYWFKEVPTGEVDIYLNHNRKSDYKSEPMLHQINENAIIPKKITDSEGISYEIKSVSDLYEIHITNPVFNQVNVTEPERVYILDSDKPESYLEYNLNNLDPKQKYIISFDFFIEAGSGPQFTTTQDTDTYDELGNIKPALRDILARSEYQNYWRNANYSYVPKPNANSANISVRAIYWNNCQSYHSEKRCQDKSLREGFNKRSIVHIKNFKIKQDFTIFPYIVWKNPKKIASGSANVSIINNKTGSYSVEIKNQILPYILVLNNSYNTAWNITDSSGNLIDMKHIRVNGYANGWLIDKELPGKVNITFNLEKKKNYGIILSIAGFLLSAICLKKIGRKS